MSQAPNNIQTGKKPKFLQPGDPGSGFVQPKQLPPGPGGPVNKETSCITMLYMIDAETNQMSVLVGEKNIGGTIDRDDPNKLLSCNNVGQMIFPSGKLNTPELQEAAQHPDRQNGVALRGCVREMYEEVFEQSLNMDKQLLQQAKEAEIRILQRITVLQNKLEQAATEPGEIEQQNDIVKWGQEIESENETLRETQNKINNYQRQISYYTQQFKNSKQQDLDAIHQAIEQVQLAMQNQGEQQLPVKCTLTGGVVLEIKKVTLINGTTQPGVTLNSLRNENYRSLCMEITENSMQQILDWNNDLNKTGGREVTRFALESAIQAYTCFTIENGSHIIRDAWQGQISGKDLTDYYYKTLNNIHNQELEYDLIFRVNEKTRQEAERFLKKQAQFAGQRCAEMMKQLQQQNTQQQDEQPQFQMKKLGGF